MATSGSYDFTVTRDQLIEDALKHIGMLGEGDSPSTTQVTETARILNMIVKLRAAEGMPAWTRKRGTLLPTTGVGVLATNSHVVTTYDSTYLSSAAASGASTVVVNAIGNIANGDQIGIELDSGDMQWTTVNGAPSGTTITLTATLTGAAAAANRVYAYTASADRIEKPLGILEANRLDVTDNSQVSIQVVGRDQYFGLSDLTQESSTPIYIFYDSLLGSNTADPATAANWFGNIYFYPRFENGNTVIQFTYHRPLQDFDSATDNPDFPQEFYLPLLLELAALIGPKYGVSISERNSLLAEAELYREKAMNTLFYNESVQFVPDSSFIGTTSNY